MAVTGKLYGKAFLSLFNKEIDWDSDDIYVMLTTVGYVPDQDVHDYKDDVTNEVTGAGYAAGGLVLAGKTITYTGATNKIMLDALDSEWPNASITARVAVVYDRTPATDPTRPLMGYQLSDADIISTAGTWKITWNASGIFEITVA